MGKIRLHVNWDKYISINNIEFIHYVSRYQNQFMETLVDNVIDAHKNKTPSLVLFRFSKTTITSTAYLSDYEVILRRLMTICEKVELYELCAKILKYSNRVHTKTKTNKILKVNGQ